MVVFKVINSLIKSVVNWFSYAQVHWFFLQQINRFWHSFFKVHLEGRHSLGIKNNKIKSVFIIRNENKRAFDSKMRRRNQAMQDSRCITFLLFFLREKKTQKRIATTDEFFVPEKVFNEEKHYCCLICGF